MLQWKRLSGGQKTAYGWGLAAALLGAALLLSPGRESWHAAGPHNVGHERTDCQACHTNAPGTVVGQAVGNLLHAAGLAESAPHFVFSPAGNEQCLACHDNPDDRHPVAEFTEPEFAEARRAAGVQSCLGCHRQHLGIRVSASPRVCRNCHQDTTVEDDPVDIPHAELFDDSRWDTCLGCHDFHGNHNWTPPTRMADAFTEQRIRQYFEGGSSPYGRRRLTAIITMRREQSSGGEAPP